MRDRNRFVRCGLCSGGGLLALGRLCPGCEGAGRLSRFVLSLPVVTPALVQGVDGPWWSRLVILATDFVDGRTTARAMTENGQSIAVTLKNDALRAANRALFAELGSPL